MLSIHSIKTSAVREALTVLITSCTFFSFSQVESYTKDTEFKGPIKSVYTYDYRTNTSDFETLDSVDRGPLQPTCEVCEHFEKFDKKGKLIEKQEYVIIEPVSDLGMGYCLYQNFEYKRKELVLIIARKSEFHEMGIWGYDEGSKTEDTIYSIEKNGETVTTKYLNEWETLISKHYRNGLLIQDEYQEYFYDDNGRLIKRVPIAESTSSKPNIETWTYKDGLLEKYTQMKTGHYFFGSQTQFIYYPSGKLFSESNYRLNGPDKTDEKELRSVEYFFEDGRDSASLFVNIYSSEKTERKFRWEYLFHPNGVVSTKTQKTKDGEICGFETFDARGNLTQRNAYNTKKEAYKIDRYTYNDKNELIEMHVVDNYNEEEYTMIFTYDEYGNNTLTHRKEDDVISLTQKQVFDYFR